jgi:hypothetical protein
MRRFIPLVIALACASRAGPAVPPVPDEAFEEGRRYLAARQWEQASHAFERFVKGCPTLVAGRCAEALLLQGQAESELGDLGQAIMATMKAIRRSSPGDELRGPAGAQLARLKQQAERWWQDGPADGHLEVTFESAELRTWPRSLTLTIDARPMPAVSAAAGPAGGRPLTLYAGPAPSGSHVVDVQASWPGEAAAITRLIRVKPGSALAIFVTTAGRARVLQIEEATLRR